MLNHFLDLDVADASLTGFASNVTGAAFVLTTNATSDGLAHRVSIQNDSVTNHSGKTVTLIGTDADNRALTEIMTAPGTSATVESVKYFKTLTSATPSATIGADTFDIGWVDEIASQTVMLNRWSPYTPGVQLDITGTLSLTIEVTFSPREHFELDSAVPVLWQPTGYNGLVNAVSDSVSPDSIEGGLTAARVVFDSYSSGAEAQVIIQEPAF